MKLLIISALILVILVTYSLGQTQRCHGRQWSGSCWAQRNQGHGGGGCRGYNAYYFDRGARQCRPMYYHGCGGNNNRWCNRNNCRRGCGGR